MIVNNASLAAVGVKEEQYPKTGLPEIAMAGKSNVGKSSLINTLLRRKALAHTRQTLLQVIVLVDGRHEPSANDVQMLEWIRSFGYAPTVIATKMDKMGKQQQAKALKLIRQTLHLESGQLFPFSALTKDGTEAIWEMLDKLLAEAEGSKE